MVWNKGLKGNEYKKHFKNGFKGTFKKGHRKGEVSFNSKGGRHLTSGGYVLVLCREHPYCDPKGYVREHRLVMEQHLGRYLEPYEIAHHINGIKDDNRIENLKLKEWSEHSREHMKKFSIERNLKISESLKQQWVDGNRKKKAS